MNTKNYLKGFFYSLPIQLFFLHFRRYQVFLIFWFVLFATVSGNFMTVFGASSLFLAPEYLDEVNILSTAIVGLAIGIFVMSWNITTFILHAKHIKFLATTAQPFLKYCINNGVFPFLFLLLYFYELISYNSFHQLRSFGEVLILLAGFLLGLILAIAFTFFYFYGIDKRVYKRYGAKISKANKIYHITSKRNQLPPERGALNIEWFLSARLGLRKARDVRHYSQEFLDSIFKQHHFAAIAAVVLAFVFLIVIGYFSNTPFFQIPAAASVAIFFAILIAVAGAFALFLKTWSIPLLVTAYFVINWMFQHHWIDPRNKVFGLTYNKKEQRSEYNRNAIIQLASTENIEKDKKAFIDILNNWKKKQGSAKPVMYLVNVSGGGLRSSGFSLEVMQRLDSITGGNFMKQTFMITGASGGMLGAAYFRELYWMKLKGHNINLQNQEYSDNISKDLLNPLFSSFVTNDVMAPTQTVKYKGNRYRKDRGYAFEQKLNDNTERFLDKTLSDYVLPERNAIIPMMLYHSVVTMDGRQFIISTQPARFFMRAVHDTSNLYATDPDAIDYVSFFEKNTPYNTRILSALRMNATFPYVLPNVLLPTDPVVDVMDAGLRDNYGLESSLRFINAFEDWLKENTSKVIIIQIRGRRLGEWEKPSTSGNFFGEVTSPIWLLQNNYYKLQDYYLDDQLQYVYNGYGPNLYRINIQYVPSKEEAHASLSYHLTESEKKDIRRALDNIGNTKEFNRLIEVSKE